MNCFPELNIAPEIGSTFTFARPMSFTLTFTRPNGSTVGILRENESGQLSFYGEAAEAARAFFDAAITNNSLALAALRQQLLDLGVTPAA